MTQWKRWALLWASLFCFWRGMSEAAEMTSSFPVTAQVVPVCTVATVPLNFGPMMSGETVMQTVELLAKCTQSTPYQLILDGGLHGSAGLRNMADAGGNLIPYRLYKDTTHSVEWTEGVAGATSAVGTGLDQPHTLHGVASPSALVPAGVYADTVSVTILY